jgi:hypothetical protein
MVVNKFGVIIICYYNNIIVGSTDTCNSVAIRHVVQDSIIIIRNYRSKFLLITS